MLVSLDSYLECPDGSHETCVSSVVAHSTQRPDHGSGGLGPHCNTSALSIDVFTSTGHLGVPTPVGALSGDIAGSVPGLSDGTREFYVSMVTCRQLLQRTQLPNRRTRFRTPICPILLSLAQTCRKAHMQPLIRRHLCSLCIKLRGEENRQWTVDHGTESGQCHF